jgi:amino acid adenylation domain-containing protein
MTKILEKVNPMNDNRYHRNVSDNEQLYVNLQELFSTFAIHLVVEGIGVIDPKALQIAVEKASEACPAARLIQSGGMWIDSYRTPPVHLLNNGQFDGKDFTKIKLLEKKIDSQKGPTSEVIILQLNPMIVVFRVFHGTMDGKGVLLWINNTFRALRGETLIPIKGKETDLSFLKLQKNHSHKNNFMFDVRTLDQRFTIENHQVWRQRLTIPGRPACLVAKIAETITSYGTSHNNRFLVPVDMRRHQKKHLSNANLTLPIFLETTKEDSWCEIHKNLLTGLQNNQEMNLKSADLGFLIKMPRLLLNWGIRAMNAWQNLTNKHVIGGVISDLGMVDLEALTTDDFQAKTLYSLTVQQPFAPFTVAIASNKYATEIMISCYENKQLIDHANLILKAIKNNNCTQHADVDFNSTKKAYPSHKTVLHLIEEQINKSPDAIAIRYAEKTFSYSTLGGQIDQIAEHLLRLGIGSGNTVAVYMNRSELLMPAILAVLKTGAAYIPLDCESPMDRINKILQHSNISVCITDTKLKHRLSSIEGGSLVVIDDIDLNKQKVSFNCLAESDQIAYQMYTSGSTGLPKGVQIEHRSLVNYLQWAKDEYLVNEQSSFPLFASIAFDSTITSMFLPLIAGGNIELFDEKISHSVLKKITESQRITHVKLSPAHLQLVANIDHIPGCPKMLIIGGEQLNLKLVERIYDLCGYDWKIINEYGPTEATVGCITYTYDPALELSGSAVPIGRPIMNTKVYLLDKDRRPITTGLVGEIYISGDCLARAYANDPTLTEQKFVILFEGERAFKTGDLAQFNENGDLVYISRIDEQISIHGNRIEIGEIENAIVEYKGIAEAALIVKQNKAGKNVLIAFYTAENSIDEESLKKHLQRRLPSYVQLHFFVHLDVMPLTFNHKVNKQALPIPDINVNFCNEQGVGEAVSVQEQILIEIWREVLELEKDCHIRLSDNFYYLGGDSLGMLIVLNEIIARILDNQHEELFMKKMNDIVKSPTIKNFSRILSTIKEAHQAIT